MHTIMVLTGGFALLAAFLIGAPMVGMSRAAGALAFIPLWFACAAFNMWVGVTNAGYTVAQEFPIFLGVFGVPALAALALWWRLSRG